MAEEEGQSRQGLSQQEKIGQLFNRVFDTDDGRAVLKQLELEAGIGRVLTTEQAHNDATFEKGQLAPIDPNLLLIMEGKRLLVWGIQYWRDYNENMEKRVKQSKMTMAQMQEEIEERMLEMEQDFE